MLFVKSIDEGYIYLCNCYSNSVGSI